MPELPSAPSEFLDNEVNLCQHSRTNDVKTISEVLLAQVNNLQKTDREWRENLEIAGGSLEQIRFVRGANYLSNMSGIVQRQEKEIRDLTMQVQRKYLTVI